MLEEVKTLTQMANGQIHSPITLLLGWTAEIVFINQIDNLISGLGANATLRILIYSLLLFVWLAYWLRYRYVLPKNKKGKVGIVIAIFSENEIERQKLKADFINVLTKNLRDEGLLKIAEVIFLKNHFAKKIFESNSPADEIRKMNKNIHAHFFAWGIIKKRPDEKSDDCKYYLSFGGGYITHRPVPNDISNELSKDFSKVLVPSISFSERFFQGFEISAQFIHLAVKYIIGLAAYISQDPQLAFKFHTGLKEQCKEFPHLQIIKKKLPFLLSEEALWIARWHEDKGRFQESKEFVQKALTENNNSYGGWLLKARLDFREGNIDDAFHSTKKAEDCSGARGEWRYSKAFLHFWVGNFTKSLKVCQKIKSQTYDGEPATCEDVIAFNLSILETENNKPQLYFWIGFLSYFKKHNLGDALEYLEKFEELADNNMNELKSKSSTYLTEIRRQMDISNQSATS